MLPFIIFDFLLYNYFLSFFIYLISALFHLYCLIYYKEMFDFSLLVWLCSSLPFYMFDPLLFNYLLTYFICFVYVIFYWYSLIYLLSVDFCSVSLLLVVLIFVMFITSPLSICLMRFTLYDTCQHEFQPSLSLCESYVFLIIYTWFIIYDGVFKIFATEFS